MCARRWLSLTRVFLTLRSGCSTCQSCTTLCHYPYCTATSPRRTSGRQKCVGFTFPFPAIAPTRDAFKHIARWLKDVPRARVHACGRKIAVHQWWQEVANSNFTVAPSGTFPATFMLYEAMLLGSIPVLVFSAAEYTLWGRDTTISREHLSDDDIDRLMPYYVRAQSNTARSASVYLLPRPRARRTKASASLGQASSSRKRQVRTSRGLLRRPWPPFPAV